MSSYLALKLGYINKTYTYTQSRAENSLLQFCQIITKLFSPFYRAGPRGNENLLKSQRFTNR